MVASSLHPGSLVSVSLASSYIKEGFCGSPLESIEEKFAKQFGIRVGNNTLCNAGSFFALATIYPSSEVLKNGVKLSRSLSYMMGCPEMGKMVFLTLVQDRPLGHPFNGIEKFPYHMNEISHFPTTKCTDLYLRVLSSIDEQRMHCDFVFPVDMPLKDGCEHPENDQISSPKTPSPYQSKSSSLRGSQAPLKRCEKSTVILNHQSNVTFLDSFAAKNALENEKVKVMLEVLASWMLRERFLLHGNIVAIPVGPQVGFFRIDAAETTSCKWFQQVLHEGKCNLLYHGSSTPCPPDLVDIAFQVEAKTKVHLISSSPLENNFRGDLPHTEADESFDIAKLGGLSNEFAELKQIIYDKIQHHANYAGILLYGPPGTGKTSMAYSCAHDVGLKLFSVNGPEIVSGVYGKSEQDLYQVFDKAKQVASAMVFIDEFDAIAPARQDGSERLSQRLVATLLKLMDAIRSTRVIVVAATNRIDSIDPALRRHGRFDREIEIGVPSQEQRLDILLTRLGDMSHSLVKEEIHSLASTTHGFVGADLAALCNKAALIALCRYAKLKHPNGLPTFYQHLPLPNHLESMTCMLSDLSISREDDIAAQSYETSLSSGFLSNDDGAFTTEQEALLVVTFDDFQKAKKEVGPSAMREVMVEVPNVSWDDIGGQDEVKKQLMEVVEWRHKYQDLCKCLGLRPPLGVLMFGPPGCSKTLMARALASNSGLNFLAVKGPELFSKWVGESEKAIRLLFRKARAVAPSIIFFDEFDGLATIRGQENDGFSVSDRVIAQLLTELDGFEHRGDVIVIAATNRPDKIDQALLRPGRFDRLLYVGPPNEDERGEIFGIHLRKMPCGSDVSLGALASLTKGCTGADITSICRKAALAALEENMDVSEVWMRHFELAIGKVQPLDLQPYHEFSRKFQRHVRIGSSGKR